MTQLPLKGLVTSQHPILGTESPVLWLGANPSYRPCTSVPLSLGRLLTTHPASCDLQKSTMVLICPRHPLTPRHWGYADRPGLSSVPAPWSWPDLGVTALCLSFLICKLDARLASAFSTPYNTNFLVESEVSFTHKNKVFQLLCAVTSLPCLPVPPVTVSSPWQGEACTFRPHSKEHFTQH